MNLAQLEQLLETYGSDETRWPRATRDAARRLITTNSDAQRALERAYNMDVLIKHHLSENQQTAEIQQSATRVMAALHQKLPQQKGQWRLRLSRLLDFDLFAASPRLAALPAVVVLGFLVGLSDFSHQLLGSPSTLDTDVSAIVFDSDSLTGLR